MAWSESKMFREFARGALGGQGGSNNVLPTSYAGIVADTVKAALFNDTITPDKDAAAADARYGAGAWASGGVSDTLNSNWAAAGRDLSSKTLTVPSSGVCRYDAADTAGGGTLTITNAYGCLVYDDTTSANVQDLGICYNYFGGAQSVTGGTFTIVWSANGIFEITT